jgi:hypothetical protein
VSRRDVERLLDALGWGWNTSLSRMLDAAVIAEEEGRA